MTDEEDLDWFEAGKCRLLYKLGLLPTSVQIDPESGEEVKIPNDPGIFFPEKGESTRPAKKICRGEDGRPPCKIIEQCQYWAVRNERYGVWGGLSERERVNARVAPA